ncbi:MAG: hypothetical protein QW572_07245 [Candidatus Nitrosocaldus sp.]
MMYTLLYLILYFITLNPLASEEAEDIAKALGWMAIGIGVIANVIFILYNRVRKLSLTYLGSSSSNAIRSLAVMYKPMLNMHIALNTIGYIAGMVHGLLFIRYLEPITLSLAIVMSVLMLSGLLLRYTSSRDVKIFNRLLHGQSILTIMLVLLIMLHVFTADD